MTYGTVRFELFGEPWTAALTDAGWQAVSRNGAVPRDPAIAGLLDTLAHPSDFGPADGDPMAMAVIKLAGMLHGTYELAALPGPDPGPGAIY